MAPTHTYARKHVHTRTPFMSIVDRLIVSTWTLMYMFMSYNNINRIIINLIHVYELKRTPIATYIM